MARYIVSKKEIDEYLMAKDEKFGRLIETCKPVQIKLADDCFSSLTEAVIGQQLSGKVADVIFKRVYNLCSQHITPGVISELPVESLREAGMSYSKINYLKYLAKAVEEKTVSFDNLDSLSNENIITMLTAVKGIGQWTAEMFLIFTLGREDVFSAGDGGLQRAISKIYGIDEKLTKGMLEEISGKWKPFRTYASLYLWKSLNN